MILRPNRSDEYTQERDRRLLQDEYAKELRTGRPSPFRRRQLTLKDTMILLVLVIVLGAVVLLLLELVAPRQGVQP